MVRFSMENGKAILKFVRSQAKDSTNFGKDDKGEREAFSTPAAPSSQMWKATPSIKRRRPNDSAEVGSSGQAGPPGHHPASCQNGAAEEGLFVQNISQANPEAPHHDGVEQGIPAQEDPFLDLLDGLVISEANQEGPDPAWRGAAVFCLAMELEHITAGEGLLAVRPWVIHANLHLDYVEAAARHICLDLSWPAIEKTVAKTYNDIVTDLSTDTDILQPPIAELRAGYFLGRPLSVLKMYSGQHTCAPGEVRVAESPLLVPPVEEGLLQRFASASPRLLSFRQKMQERVQKAVNGDRQESVLTSYVITQRELFHALPVIFRQLCNDS